MSDSNPENRSSSTRLRANVRKLSKPLLERRRRARMNRSLSLLKVLVLQTLHKHTSQHTKLEKSDILELAVKHIRNIKQKSVLQSYRAGFGACAHQVAHFLSSCEGVSSEMRMRLLAHLARCLSVMTLVTPPLPAAGTSSAHLSISGPRSSLSPPVLRHRPVSSGRFTPFISGVVHVHVRGQLWRPW